MAVALAVRHARMAGQSVWPLNESMAPKRVELAAQTFNRFDDDGLRNSLKPVLDGLVDAGVLHSDAPDSGHHVTYRQTINRRSRGIHITVTAIEI